MNLGRTVVTVCTKANDCEFGGVEVFDLIRLRYQISELRRGRETFEPL